jgi:phage gpG-like protein
MTEPGIKHNLKDLDNFVNALSKDFTVRVGILGKKAAQDHGGLTNAQVGAVHEFGSYKRHIPARSFLRVPLFQKQQDIIKQVGKNALAFLSKGDFQSVFLQLGVACVGVITDAFQSGGFGAWKKLKPATIRRKIQKNPQPLIDTRQLSRSITYDFARKK